jgi:hypothetical protein
MRLPRVRFTVRGLLGMVLVVAVAIIVCIWVERARYWMGEAGRWALHERLELREAAESEEGATWARGLVARGETQAGLQPTALAVKTFEAVASAHRMRAKEFARLKRLCWQRSLSMTHPDRPLSGRYIDVGEAYRSAVQRYRDEQCVERAH